MSDAAIASIVTGMVTMTTIVAGFLTIWVKMKYGAEKAEEVSKKVDNNTEITKRGIEEAGTHAAIAADAAKDAASAATHAAVKTDALSEQLNGKLEAKIGEIVKGHIDGLKGHVESVVTMFHAHSAQDDKNMAEIRQALGELRDRTKLRALWRGQNRCAMSATNCSRLTPRRQSIRGTFRTKRSPTRSHSSKSFRWLRGPARFSRRTNWKPGLRPTPRESR